MVSLAYDSKNTDPFKVLIRKGIPVVFFDRVFECPGCVSIVIDNYKAGYEATSHLIAQGCKRIIHLGGNLLRNVYADRFKGYKQALKDYGIEFDQSLVFITDLSEQSGTETAHRILSMKNRPDGVFTANDTSAVATICELQLSGIKIPYDIAVVGFNNEPISRVVQPNLTTIHYPAMEVGEIAASTLINKLNNMQSANLSTIVLEHSLIIRKSSERKRTD
jgi:LacI family transcriptional regulator